MKEAPNLKMFAPRHPTGRKQPTSEGIPDPDMIILQNRQDKNLDDVGNLDFSVHISLHARSFHLIKSSLGRRCSKNERRGAENAFINVVF